MVFLEFAHNLWDTPNSTSVLTDNKSVKRFFQTKANPASIWMLCHYLLQISLKVVFIADSVNTTADFLSRLELKVTEKIRLNICEDIQTTPIEVTTSSSHNADEEKFHLTKADNYNVSEEQTVQQKEQSR